VAELLAKSGRVTTIAGAMPRLERNVKPRHRPLAHACLERTGVTLLYGEGDAPAQLTVHPRFLFEMGSKSYLEAECGLSGTLKTYRLDRIRKVLA
jgi:predicted DNA-binding transcriptional regulator YafY